MKLAGFKSLYKYPFRWIYSTIFNVWCIIWSKVLAGTNYFGNFVAACFFYKTKSLHRVTLRIFPWLDMKIFLLKHIKKPWGSLLSLQTLYKFYILTEAFALYLLSIPNFLQFYCFNSNFFLDSVFIFLHLWCLINAPKGSFSYLLFNFPGTNICLSIFNLRFHLLYT